MLNHLRQAGVAAADRHRRGIRARRLATIVLAATFAFGASGCYIGSSTVGPGEAALWCPPAVDLGPGHISRGAGTDSAFYLWQPARTTATLQFSVTSSDSTQPITVEADYVPYNSVTAAAPFGVVWDGTRSTGTRSIPWSGQPFFLVAPVANVTHLDWSIAALDATGVEVGFTACVPWDLFGGGGCCW